MSFDPNLITTYNFKDRDFLIKMNITKNMYLELVVTEKYTSESWQCSYDATYIENLTHRTGNFKQFDIFTTMLRSGLLKTSECISLDLLTFEDLEVLRTRKMRNCASSRSLNNIMQQSTNNRRYLIVTYSVEFDRIHYPLPLEYCGPPDPQILQANIRRLETEVAKLEEQLNSQSDVGLHKELNAMKKKVDDLTMENQELQEEIRHLNKLVYKHPRKHVQFLQNAIRNLEESVLSERNSHQKLVKKLYNEKSMLEKEINKLKNPTQNIKVQNPLKTSNASMSRLVSRQSSMKHSSGASNSRLTKRYCSSSPQNKHLQGDMISRYPGDGVGSPIVKAVCKAHSVPLKMGQSESWDNIHKQNRRQIPKPSRSSSAESNRSGASCSRHSRNTTRKSKASNKKISTRNHSNCSCTSKNSQNSSVSSASAPRTTNRKKVSKYTLKKSDSKTSEYNLESRIAALQKLLKDDCYI